ncbi:carbonic anhydrase [Meredithblackwellia eburnea MCA 4105]
MAAGRAPRLALSLARGTRRTITSNRPYPPWPAPSPKYPQPGHKPPPPPLTSDILRDILDRNQEYADAFTQADPVLLSKLAKGQQPRIFWLGCSDSRVSAELATGVAPGSIFVHRNVANTFHTDDTSALAALHYAVHVLKVDAIVVCGHTGCGGVLAAMESAAADQERGAPPPPPATEGDRIIGKWIAPIKSLASTQLALTPNSNVDVRDPFSFQSLTTLTERHVAETVRTIAESSIVTKAWEEGKKLEIHGWMYHVGTARLHDLGIGVKGADGVPARK